MGRLKILLTTGDFSKYLHKSFYYLQRELAKWVDLTVWHHSGSIHHILDQVHITPDFILVNEYGETNSPHVTDLSAINIPYGLYFHDLHYKVDKRRKMLEQENPLCIFSYYRDKFYQLFPMYKHLLVWMPHHVEMNVFNDYKEKKSIPYLLMGSVHPHIYPLRYKVLLEMQKEFGFVYHKHPGYRNFESNSDALIDHNYAREINKAKIFFTCDSKYKYPLNKYFEVLACNTLLLAPTSKELEDLGFIPDQHFVAITDRDFKEKARYYLLHEKKRLEIAKRGYQMVSANHTTQVRAKQLVSTIKKLLKRRNT